jgi:hypothetical protein
MHENRSRLRPAPVVALLLAFAACGSDTPAPTTPVTTPPTLPPSTLPPAPVPIPSTDAKCGSLPAGPITRVAVAPRQHDENGVQAEMRVLVREEFSDEVLCVDKDQDHKIDFNLNQRNADGKESCWRDQPGWAVRDPAALVTSQQPRDQYGFIFRVRISPGGRTGRVGVSAELDEVQSHPWQSSSGYAPGPLWIEAMDREGLKNCKCVYLGNGGYEGEGCTKFR